MSFTPAWNVVPGEVATAVKMSQLGANDDYLKTEVEQAAPVGSIQAYPGALAPDGWLLCDGTAISRSTYPELFTLLGTGFGAGDGSTTFNLPNLKGRAIVGRDAAQAEFSDLAEIGGAKSVTLGINEMPHHGHGVNDPGHAHTGPFATNQIIQKIVNASDGAHGFSDGATTRWSNSSGTGIWLSGTGGGAAHNNLQPYMVLNYIIKA